MNQRQGGTAGGTKEGGEKVGIVLEGSPVFWSGTAPATLLPGAPEAGDGSLVEE
jgi:hypothetical protein